MAYRNRSILGGLFSFIFKEISSISIVEIQDLSPEQERKRLNDAMQRIDDKENKRRAELKKAREAVLIKGVNDLVTVRPDLIKDWDWDGNEVSPEELTIKDKDPATKWLCPKGRTHSYSSSVANKVADRDYCTTCARIQDRRVR